MAKEVDVMGKRADPMPDRCGDCNAAYKFRDKRGELELRCGHALSRDFNVRIYASQRACRLFEAMP